MNKPLQPLKHQPTQELYFEKGLGTRLRRLVERLAADGDRIYQEAGLDFRVSYFYAIFALAEKGPMGIGALTQISGLSQPAVSQTIKRLEKLGLVKGTPGSDARHKTISLTTDGKTMVGRLQPVWNRLEDGIKEAISESGYDLVSAIDAMEDALDRRPLFERASINRTDRPRTEKVEIIPYDARYKEAFRDLNYHWLETFFEIEPIDKKALTDPEGYILNEGGEILFALADGKPVGCAALKHDGDGVFEFTKYAVDPSAQGLGIGRRLMDASIDRYRARAGKKLYLETNTKLTTARAVYDKTGWVEIPASHESPYARANCLMVWQGDQA